MGKWHRKEFIKIFWKLQKGEGLYWLLQILDIVVMSLATYLFLFFLWIYQRFMENTQQNGGEFGSILEFSQHGLHILIVCSIFIGILTLQSLCYFRAVKNQRKTVILRLLGMRGSWLAIFDIMEATIVIAVSFLPAFIGAKILFLLTTKEMIGTEQLPMMQSAGMLIRIFFVSIAMFVLLLVSYRIARSSEAHKTIGEQLRGIEHNKSRGEKQKRNRLFVFFIAIYLIILFVISEQMATILIGTVILFVLGLCSYALSLVGVRITEKYVNRFRRKKGYRADFLHLALQTGSIKKKNTFLITVMTTGLLLFYFLSSIDWGLESFLERFWMQSRQTNLYVECGYGEEQKIETWLNERELVCQKIYVKDWQEEEMTLAVSQCTDESSPYYVQQGHMRTILYNLYRWGVSEGDTYRLSQNDFLIDEPMKEEGFQLISYSCLINYEDWKNQLDETYTTVFAMCVNKEMLQVIGDWAEENGIGIMTSSNYISMVKQIYAPYLRMLEVILLILSASILLFYFASILSNIITREREFFVYRGCGVGWRKIRSLVLIQYLYIAFLGSLSSALLYGTIFNAVKMLWFGNSTVYFVGMRQMIIITVFVLGFIGAECYIAMRFMQKRSGSAVIQLRAE